MTITFEFYLDGNRIAYHFLEDGKRVDPLTGWIKFQNSLPGYTHDERQETFKELQNEAFVSWAEANDIPIKADQLPSDMRSALENRGHILIAIQNMSAETAFEEALAWNGIIGYGQKFLAWAKSIETVFPSMESTGEIHSLEADLARKDTEIKARKDLIDALGAQVAGFAGRLISIEPDMASNEYLGVLSQNVQAARANLAKVKREGDIGAFFDGPCPECSGNGCEACGGSGLVGWTGPAIETPRTEPTIWSRNLYRRRENSRVSLREMGEATGIAPSRLSELENGLPHTPTDDEIRAINEFLRTREDVSCQK